MISTRTTAIREAVIDRPIHGSAVASYAALTLQELRDIVEATRDLSDDSEVFADNRRPEKLKVIERVYVAPHLTEVHNG